MLRTLPLLALLPLLLLSAVANAQQSSPLDLRYVFPADTASLFTDLRRRGELAAESFKPYLRPGAEVMYERRSDQLIEAVRDSQYTFDPAAHDYFNQLLRGIISANGLTVDPLILLSRSPAVNASSYGDGIFVIDAGLIRKIHYREEIAFVLCHELAHDQLNHTAKRITAFAAQYDPDESKRKKRREYRRRYRREGRVGMLNSWQEAIYADKRRTRAFELSADSLGAIYLATAGYGPDAIHYSLERLDAEDEPELVRPLSAALQNDRTPFQTAWVRERKATMFGGSFGGGSAADKDSEEEGFWSRDSLSTHPKLADRIANAPEPTGTRDGYTKHALDGWADETLLRMYANGGYPAHALCLALERERSLLNDLAVLEALRVAHVAIRERRLGYRVPPPKHFDEPGRQEVLRFFHRISAADLAALGKAYAAEIKKRYPGEAACTDGSVPAFTYFNKL